MAELTSGMSGGDGDGYAPALTFAAEVHSLLDQVHKLVADFGDTLTSRNLDHETNTTVSHLLDQVEGSAATADGLHKHIEAKHGGAAAEINAMGGSGEMADSEWYDHL